MSLDVERLWELKEVHKGPASLQPRCDGVVVYGQLLVLRRTQ